MSRWSVAASVLLTAAFLGLLLLFFTHAGGLWRDEANSASMVEAIPRVHWLDLQFDSFPAGWPLLLKGWTVLAGTDDRTYRLFGLLIGAAVCGAIWLVAWIDRGGAPVVALLLIGTSGAAVRTISSIRGYGAGIVAALLLIALLRHTINRPTPLRHLGVLIAALLAAHLLYLNCALVLAAVSSAVISMLLDRRLRDAFLLLGSGAITAASMLIYLPIVHAARPWIGILQADYDFSWFWGRLREAIDPSLPVWIAVIALALFLARHRRDKVFAAALLVIAIPAYWLFLQAIHLLTSWWYYIPLLVVVAVAADMLIHVEGHHEIALALCCVIVGVPLIAGSVAVAKRRQTNVDEIAADLALSAHARDLIVVADWPVGVSYARYHRSAAPWQTAPPLSNHRWHQWDEVTRDTHDPHAMDPLVEEIEKRLGRGDRVFVIAEEPIRTTRPMALPPFRGTGRQSHGYWRLQLTQALTREGKVVRVSKFADESEPVEHPTLQVWARATS